MDYLTQFFISAKEGSNSIMDTLLHHIGDSEAFIALPSLFGIDISITKHVLIMWGVALIFALVTILAARSIKKDKSASGNRLSILVQVLLDFLNNDIVKPTFHNHTEAKKYLPFFATLFFFIMLCNLFGLIPGSATVTGNLAVTMTLATITFIATQIYGMTKKGIFRYWIKIVPEGVPLALWPLMFVIEFVGLFTKPFALMIRLFANMIAGHIVITVLLFLAASAVGWNKILVAPFAVVGSVLVDLLEILIAVIQAFIFTFLSAIFIASAGEEH